MEGKQDSVKSSSRHCFSKGRMECIYFQCNVAAMEQQVRVAVTRLLYRYCCYSFDPFITNDQLMILSLLIHCCVPPSLRCIVLKCLSRVNKSKLLKNYLHDLFQSFRSSKGRRVTLGQVDLISREQVHLA